MSDDLVNQLTLNFLISKNQLQKLNQKSKELSDQDKIKEKQIYINRIKQLFDDLLVNQPPDDLIFDVKNAFDKFIDRAIYYFKAHDNSNALEFERTTDIYEDIDFEREEKAIENGNYTERSNEDDLGQEEEDLGQEEDDLGQEEEDLEQEEQHPVIVTSKYRTPTHSIGVEDIQKLPVDWFQHVRKKYIKNNIIPRTKN